jgi:hypothetical protein
MKFFFNCFSVLTTARQQLQNGLRGFTEPLKYWRDESAHGPLSTINDEHAYTSLAMLLRFAQFSNDKLAGIGAVLNPL